VEFGRCIINFEFVVCYCATRIRIGIAFICSQWWIQWGSWWPGSTYI